MSLCVTSVRSGRDWSANEHFPIIPAAVRVPSTGVGVGNPAHDRPLKDGVWSGPLSTTDLDTSSRSSRFLLGSEVSPSRLTTDYYLAAAQNRRLGLLSVSCAFPVTVAFRTPSSLSHERPNALPLIGTRTGASW